jgi:hypothetical protein
MISALADVKKRFKNVYPPKTAFGVMAVRPSLIFFSEKFGDLSVAVVP